MFGEDKLKKIAERVLKFSKAQETEVLLSVSDSLLTRFANNQIHQNMAWKSVGIGVRVIIDKKIGVSSTNSLEEKDFEHVVNKAMELAKFQKPDPDFDSLPSPHKVPEEKNETYIATGDELADAVNTVIQKAKQNKVVASGAYSNDTSELVVANSKGVWAYH